LRSSVGTKTTRVEILEKAELPAPQAHAILKVLEPEMTSSLELLATKTDLADVRLELKAMEGRLSRWVLACVLGQTAVLMGWVSFLLSRSGGH
jgi:hypothetical protein